jgi:hypothetical protein
MSNPDGAAAQATSEETSSGQLSFADQVNNLVNSADVDDKGNLVLPQDSTVPEEVFYAATLEKRRRDTQSALGKTSQKLAAESKMREELEKRVAAQVKLDMSPEDSERLDALKYDDPEAWRVEMNKLEQKATTTVQEELNTLSTEASRHAELTRRAQVLEDFNSKAAIPITDEVLENDIPPRISRQLEKGEITFEEFLAKAEDYLVTPKKVADTKLAAQPNLGKAGGGADPAAEAVAKQDHISYANQSF